MSKLVSIAIPLFNEEQVFIQLLARLALLASALPNYNFEFVFVDDGSSDSTWSLLTRASEQDKRIVAVKLSRNFGQQAALSAALEQVNGDAVVLMDGDLQDSPEVVQQMLERFEQGVDVISVVRATREGGIGKRLMYFCYYRLLGMLSSSAIVIDSGDFCLMTRRVVQVINSMPERHRFLRGLRAWAGYRQETLPVDRPERAAGEAKYSIRKLIKLGLDGVVSFSTVPLRVALVVGVSTVLMSVFFAGYAVWAKVFLNQSPTGFTALILIMVFMSGVQLLCVGLIGEYVGRIFEQTKGRPIFLIDQIIGRG